MHALLMSLMILFVLFVSCGLYEWIMEIIVTRRYTRAWRRELENWIEEQEQRQANVRRAPVRRI